MTETDEHQNLPAIPQATVHALEIPVAEFEGEYVRHMIGKLPALDLIMDFGYARGTHLKLELEVRVRSVNVDEVTTGKNRGDLKREHKFAIEEARIVGAYTAEQADQGVGGSLAATGHDVEDEDPEPEAETANTDNHANADDHPEEEIPSERRADDYDPGF